MLKQRKLLFSALAILVSLISFAQVTTSSISGSVKDKNGAALDGATVTATHIPTGTVYKVVARKGGIFYFTNVNPGGPYKVEISYTGYKTETVNDLFLTLGEAGRIDVDLINNSSTLTEVVVTGKGRTSNPNGSQTNIGRDKLANLPTVGRNINDFVRYTPQVKLTATGGLSIAGQNNRFNSFMIDGAVNNDVFGLSDQATNGGRAGVPPISVDAIDQIVVQISPFDASLGNFTGGGINAITRSGTNNFTGSVYGFYRNNDLARKDLNGVKLSDFVNKTFGFRVGGPIIKNKLFYFFNAEIQDDERPQPFASSAYAGNSGNRIGELVTFLKTKYGYDPGEYLNNPDLIKRKNINTKIDWKINDKNKLTLSYRWTDAERTNPSVSTRTNINFVSGAEFFPSVTHSGGAELNTKFSNRASNLLRVSVTRVVDDRDIVGKPFPSLSIFDGSGTINVGSEAPSTANLLKQSILNIYNSFKLNLGKHQLNIGTDNDFNQTYNLFINRNFGAYQYNSLDDFLLGNAPTRYRRGYSLVDDGNKGGDANTKAAADFGSYRLGFFVNDDIKFSRNFTLTLGVRGDYLKFTDNPATDIFFRDTASKVISQFYDLKGAESGKVFKPSWQISPRIGFKYVMPDEGVTIRGGIGIFTGRTPLVWPGGAYQQTAVTIGGLDVNPGGGILLGGLPLPFRADVNNQYTLADFGLPANLAKPQGDLTIVAKDYKVPAVLRSSLAFDKKLSDDWTFTFEAIITNNIHEADWKNVNLVIPNIISTGPGARTIYPATQGTRNLVYRTWSTNANIQNPYSSIILLSNTTGKKGLSQTFTFTIDKAYKNGWAFNANYTFNDSRVNNEGTSSINLSNWQNMEAPGFNGKNNLSLQTSDFAIKHRINAYISRKYTYAKNLATTISFVYNGQSGTPFSYTLGNGSIYRDGVNFNDLAYIPASRAELETMPFITASGVPLAPAQQRDALWAYIEKDKYLSKRKGQFVERNGARAPFTHVIDFKLQQDISFKAGKKMYSFQLTWDVFNLTNLISKDWGRQYFFSFDQQELYRFRSYSGTTPQYTFNALQTPGTISDGLNPVNSSRWTSQIGVRFNF
jgi:hypothetical protein